MLNLAYFSITQDLNKEDRQALDDTLLSRPGEVDPETNLKPPSWWRGEEEAAAAAAGFMSSTRR